MGGVVGRCLTRPGRAGPDRPAVQVGRAAANRLAPRPAAASLTASQSSETFDRAGHGPDRGPAGCDRAVCQTFDQFEAEPGCCLLLLLLLHPPLLLLLLLLLLLSLLPLLSLLLLLLLLRLLLLLLILLLLLLLSRSMY